MPGTKCWNCGVTAHMTPIEGSASVTKRVLRVQVMGCFRCDGCRAPNIAVATGLPGNEDLLAWLVRKKNKVWQPTPPQVIPDKTFPDVPAEIAAAATEAHRCQTTARANRAAILLARSVIEATAKAKGITGRNLVSMIDQMHDRQLIRPDVRDGAHEVRHFGNDMAHGDFVGHASAEDAALVLQLMDEVLTEVYQIPGRVARAQANRAAAEARAAAVNGGRTALGPGTSPELARMVIQLMSFAIDQLPPSQPENSSVTEG